MRAAYWPRRSARCRAGRERGGPHRGPGRGAAAKRHRCGARGLKSPRSPGRCGASGGAARERGSAAGSRRARPTAIHRMPDEQVPGHGAPCTGGVRSPALAPPGTDPQRVWAAILSHRPACAGSCVSRPRPLNGSHRQRRYAVRRNFHQHHRPASTFGSARCRAWAQARTRTRRLTERPSSSAAPNGLRAALRCALSTEVPDPGLAGSVHSAGKRAVDTEVWSSLYGASRRGPEEKRSGSDGLPEV